MVIYIPVYDNIILIYSNKNIHIIDGVTANPTSMPTEAPREPGMFL